MDLWTWAGIVIAVVLVTLWVVSSYVDLETLSLASLRRGALRVRALRSPGTGLAVPSEEDRLESDVRAMLEEYARAKEALGEEARDAVARGDSDMICRLAHAFATAYARFLSAAGSRNAADRFAASAARLSGLGDGAGVLLEIDARVPADVTDPKARRELAILAVFLLHERVPEGTLDANARRFVLAHVRLGLFDGKSAA